MSHIMTQPYRELEEEGAQQRQGDETITTATGTVENHYHTHNHTHTEPFRKFVASNVLVFLLIGISAGIFIGFVMFASKIDNLQTQTRDLRHRTSDLEEAVAILTDQIYELTKAILHS